jgi:hypothetical protein
MTLISHGMISQGLTACPSTQTAIAYPLHKNQALTTCPRTTGGIASLWRAPKAIPAVRLTTRDSGGMTRQSSMRVHRAA